MKMLLNKSVFGFFLIFLVIINIVDVRGGGYDVECGSIEFVNITISNASVTVNSDNVTYFYVIPNESNILHAVIPVDLNVTKTLFNFSVNVTVPVNVTTLETNFSCGAVLENTIRNQTEYFERVVRNQLVPSQEQYYGLQLMRNNDSVRCQNDLNKLSNVILEQKVMMNASFINYNASLSILNNLFRQSKEDKSLWQILAVGLLFYSAFLTIYIAKGWSPKALWDYFVNQKFMKPMSFPKKPRPPMQPPVEPPFAGVG